MEIFVPYLPSSPVLQRKKGFRVGTVRVAAYTKMSVVFSYESQPGCNALVFSLALKVSSNFINISYWMSYFFRMTDWQWCTDRKQPLRMESSLIIWCQFKYLGGFSAIILWSWGDAKFASLRKMKRGSLDCSAYLLKCTVYNKKDWPYEFGFFLPCEKIGFTFL